MTYFGGFMLAALVWGALSFGAVYPWAYWPLVGACVLLGLIGLRADAPQSRWMRWLGASFLVVALGVCLQLIPLPRSTLLAVSPGTDRFLQDYLLGYAANPPDRHPLSIAPDQTQVGLMLFIGFAVTLLGWIRGVPHINLERFVRGLTSFGVILAVFAVVQRSLSPKEGTVLVYGFWKPLAAGGSPFGPFINRNHFAGWMLMASSMALGYAVAHIERGRLKAKGAGGWSRWIVSPEGSQFALSALAALAMGASIVISNSRSGMASFVVAIAVTAVFVWVRFSRKLRSAIVIGIAGAAVVFAVAWWAGLEATVARFSTASADATGRLGAWSDTRRMIRDFPWFGVGLNGYGTAMLQYQTGDRRLFFREAHNDYLQIAAEGGLLLSIPAAIALTIVLYQVRQRFREERDPPATRWIRVGAVTALVGIGVQSLMEFSLQMPGNAALFVAMVAIAVHRPLRSIRALSQRAP